MKKSLNRIIVVILSLVLVLSCTLSTFAVTIYNYFGYLYTIINDEMVSLYGLKEDNAELIVPDSLNDRALVDIRNTAFMNHTELTSIDFSNAVNLQRIGSFVFKGCSNLSGKLVIPSTVNTLETAVFQGTGINSIVLVMEGSGVPNQCCYQCQTLSSVTLGENIKSIGDYAFAECPSLSYVEIPATVESISPVAFDTDTVTLGVYYNSSAYNWAVDAGVDYLVLDPENMPTEPATEPATEPETVPATEPATELLGYILGDVDNNGAVESIDATWIQRYSVQMELPIPEENMVQGDVDGDGETNIYDVTFIQRYVVDLPTPYPIGEFITK